jgi:hypothetical protein
MNSIVHNYQITITLNNKLLTSNKICNLNNIKFYHYNKIYSIRSIKKIYYFNNAKYGKLNIKAFMMKYLNKCKEIIK